MSGRSFGGSGEAREGLACRLGAWLLGLDLEELERSRGREEKLERLLGLADQLLKARDQRIAWLEARVAELEAGRGFYGQ